MGWGFEDGGPRRTQLVPGTLDVEGGRLEVTTRMAPVTTMVVRGPAGERYLLRHQPGPTPSSLVERIDPVTLEPIATSPELAAGPTWPGGVGVHPDGGIHVVFGNHAHRLNPDLQRVASRTLPRDRPYNSFVVLADGHLVTKDFGGSRPDHPVAVPDRQPCELVVLEPVGL